MPTFDFPLRFQFSLRGMLIAVAIVAVLLGAFAVLSDLFAWIMIVFAWYVVPTPLVICALFGRGDIRTFSIGAIIPWLSGWFNGPLNRILFGGPIGLLISLVCTGAICGAIALATRRWIERAGVR
jgi:hypothetical protein